MWGRGRKKQKVMVCVKRQRVDLEEKKTRHTGEEKTVYLCTNWSGGLRHDRDHKAHTPWRTSTQTMNGLCQGFANNVILALAHLCPL